MMVNASRTTTVESQRTVLAKTADCGLTQCEPSTQAGEAIKRTCRKPRPMKTSATAAKYGLKGSSAVRLPIQAPEMPSVTKSNGTTQQVEARIAPITPRTGN